jgi:hypothetical protein
VLKDKGKEGYTAWGEIKEMEVKQETGKQCPSLGGRGDQFCMNFELAAEITLRGKNLPAVCVGADNSMVSRTVQSGLKFNPRLLDAAALGNPKAHHRPIARARP